MLAPELEQLVRLTSVPPYVRSMYAHLPVRLELELTLPAEVPDAPLGLRQLVKLALGSPGLRIASVHRGALGLAVGHGARRLRLDARELVSDIAELTPRILGGLLGEAGLARVVEVLAQRTQGLSTLQRITNHMLQSTDVDKALRTMLVGITSGFGLGFNRAALFVNDEHRFVGIEAVGPGDEAEAHRIWESIEFQDQTIDDFLDGPAGDGGDSRFQRFVQTLELGPTAADGDELQAALRAPVPQVFRSRSPVNESLTRMGLAPEFVLAAVRPHGRLLGLVVADNLYSGATVAESGLDDFAFFIDQTALVWENLELLERVDKLARTDDLTGLSNRREIEARLAEERSRCSRSGQSCSVMLIDVDHFKRTNDEGGHRAGDEVLRRIGLLLRNALRGHDLAGRYGGDEFLVVLPDTSRAHLVTAASRIGQLARKAGVSLSIGCATWPDDCAELDELVALADANLYLAKNAGRGRACFQSGDPVAF
ncbi:MAG: GGDEF domain-containing protein [Micrococcales bacterium]|nr:GGDEF domain-containing protein [Micrococcales bacterium]